MTAKRENLLPDYRVILLGGLFLLVVYLLLPIMAPFLIAAIFAYICNPLVDRLAQVRLWQFTLGRTVASLLVMLMLIAIICILLLIVIPMMQKEFMLIMEKLPSYITGLRTRIEPWLLQHFGIAVDIDAAKVQQVISSNWKSASDFVGKFLLALSDHGLALFAWLANLVLIPIVLFYLLRDWHDILNRFDQLLPRRWYAKTVEIAREVDMMLAEFLRGQLSVMLLMSAFYATGLWLSGLELALPIGLIAGLLGFVPYLGIGTGMLLAALASVLQFTTFAQYVPVIAVFGIGQMLESMWLTPWLVGDRIGLHPVMVIFALLAGGQLFGFTGILLALPVSAAIAVGLRHAKRAYLNSDIYLH